MLIKMSEIKGFQPQRDHGDLTDLKNSIKKLGLLEPLGVTKGGDLVFGRRRYQALKELGVEEVDVKIVDPANEYEKFLMALHENTKRKNLTDVEENECEEYEKKLYEEQFPETKHGGDRKSENIKSAKCALDSYAEVKARVDGVDPSTIRRRLQAAKAVREKPELKKLKTTSAILREVRREDLKKKISALPTEKYRVVYADPPWKYGSDGLSGSAECHYPTMSIDDLCALNVRSIIDDSAVLFMWVTSPILAECWPVIKAWGFEYKASFIWDVVFAHNRNGENKMKITILCSWCNRIIQWGDNPTMDFAHGKVSHGICFDCAKRFLEENNGGNHEINSRSIAKT
jgi:ParB-like chromosome segregation protein Spo0J